jgi:uncharacterized membrane protein YdfJ with MMPL/SSD domain
MAQLPPPPKRKHATGWKAVARGMLQGVVAGYAISFVATVAFVEIFPNADRSGAGMGLLLYPTLAAPATAALGGAVAWWWSRRAERVARSSGSER